MLSPVFPPLPAPLPLPELPPEPPLPPEPEPLSVSGSFKFNSSIPRTTDLNFLAASVASFIPEAVFPAPSERFPIASAESPRSSSRLPAEISYFHPNI